MMLQGLNVSTSSVGSTAKWKGIHDLERIRVMEVRLRSCNAGPVLDIY
jgi:hypothetical protein